VNSLAYKKNPPLICTITAGFFFNMEYFLTIFFGDFKDEMAIWYGF